MEQIKIATAQFQPKDGDKAYNLFIIERLVKKAKEQDADIVCFHELSITAYTFLKDLSYEEMVDLAEVVEVNDENNKRLNEKGEVNKDRYFRRSPSIHKLMDIATRYDIAIMAGLVEIDDNKLYNTYVVVDKTGIIAKHRKLHPFISKYLSPGNEYNVFDLLGWKCGILICYDNNIVENVRATTLLGADIIFAPHVTGLTPSAMPGRGYVDEKLWENRYIDPVPLRMELDGPKGRAWLMRWLPARAYDNGVYYVFSNPIGYDGDQLKNGNAMILDPYGEILDEVKSFDDGLAIAIVVPEKLKLAGGYRYRNARRPELYRDILGKDHSSETKPVWMTPQK